MTPLRGFEPRYQAPQACVLSKLDYRGTLISFLYILYKVGDCLVSINDFVAFDIRVGKILEVGDIEGARKPLYQLKVDLGELGVKNIAAGIKDVYTPEQLVGKSVIVLANLEPKNIANFISEGMVLAAESEEGKVVLLRPDDELPPGSKIR